MDNIIEKKKLGRPCKYTTNEERIEAAKEYRKENRDKIRNQNKQWKRHHRDEILKYHKEYNKQHNIKDKIKGLCTICNVYTTNLSQHNKTKRHIKKLK